MIEPGTSIRRSPRATFRRLDDGTAVVLHLDTAQYHGVNEVGAAIWELADDGVTFDALLDGLREKLDDVPDRLESDVEEFLRALAERGLVEIGAPSGDG
jgi:hypothetical protein